MMESGDDHHASILSIVSSIESINDEIFVLLPQHVFITPTLYDIKTKTNKQWHQWTNLVEQRGSALNQEVTLANSWFQTPVSLPSVRKAYNATKQISLK